MCVLLRKDTNFVDYVVTGDPVVYMGILQGSELSFWEPRPFLEFIKISDYLNVYMCKNEIKEMKCWYNLIPY